LFFKLAEHFNILANEKTAELNAAMHCIDFEFLFDFVMSNGVFLKNILQQFLKQFPGEMEELKEAVESGNTKQAGSLAHHIQSTVSVLGRNSPFFIQLEKMETLAADNCSREELAAGFDQLEKFRQLLMQDINRLLEADFE